MILFELSLLPLWFYLISLKEFKCFIALQAFMFILVHPHGRQDSSLATLSCLHRMRSKLPAWMKELSPRHTWWQRSTFKDGIDRVTIRIMEKQTLYATTYTQVNSICPNTYNKRRCNHVLRLHVLCLRNSRLQKHRATCLGGDGFWHIW